MNLMFMGLIYPTEELKNISSLSKSPLQMQVDNFQKLLIEGLSRHIGNDNISICNALPVGTFPNHYKKIYLRGNSWGKNRFNVAAINLPFFKQKMREILAEKAILKWYKQNEKNRNILLYSLYLPFMNAIVKAKETYSDLNISIIVPDIPTDLGLASGRTGLLGYMENKMGKKSIELCRYFDNFILLTEPMKDVLPLNKNAKYTVVEAIAPNAYPTPNKNDVIECFEKYKLPFNKPTVLYTGTIQKELGIGDLVDAFKAEKLKNVNLVLCGGGNMASEVKSASENYGNIHYLGFVPREDALLLQAEASILINPRKPEGEYTKYSFPSKSMEYLLSGKPVLCYKLEGISAEYDDHFYYIGDDLADSILEILNLNDAEKAEKAKKAKAFVLENKNAEAQSKKIVDLIKSK
ncbi:MAG: glycosyltransferase family 4 protein [Christensenellaceae bacterium]|nr:glycosyltransferase family 4 protein [Christensenellaceae bacterium]